MSVLARITSDNKLILKGTVNENGARVRLFDNGIIECRKVYTELEALNDSDMIDEAFPVEEDVDENYSVNIFLSNILGTNTEMVRPDKVMFYDRVIVANEVLENQNL